MVDTWHTKEWQEARDKFIAKKIKEGKGFCEWCGATEKLVPAHKKKRGGYTQAEYLDLEKNCIVLCSTCNYMEGKGFKICPKCKRRYFKPKRKRKGCWQCFIQTPVGKDVKAYRDAHPELYTKTGRKKKKKETGEKR